VKTLLFYLTLIGLAITAFADTPQEQIAARAGLEQKLTAQVPLNTLFRDEHGNSAALGHFFGTKPVILALVYYQCPNLCTLVLNGLLQTAQELRFNAGKEYEIVVVSFDPHERPALAAAKKQTYIQRYGRAGAADGWHFLTGDEIAIARLAHSVGYRFAYDPQTRQFAHPSTIIVLTPQGKIARYFPGIEFPPRAVRSIAGSRRLACRRALSSLFSLQPGDRQIWALNYSDPANRRPRQRARARYFHRAQCPA